MLLSFPRKAWSRLWTIESPEPSPGLSAQIKLAWAIPQLPHTQQGRALQKLCFLSSCPEQKNFPLSPYLSGIIRALNPTVCPSLCLKGMKDVEELWALSHAKFLLQHIRVRHDLFWHDIKKRFCFFLYPKLNEGFIFRLWLMPMFRAMYPSEHLCWIMHHCLCSRQPTTHGELAPQRCLLCTCEGSFPFH